MSIRTTRILRSSGLGVLLLVVALGGGRPATAQQQPVAVVAVAGVDRLLEDVDYLFDAADAPQHAQMIRGVVSSLNELRGLDRERPVGVYLYFPVAGENEPKPLLFFPVSDVETLMSSVRLGNALRLERGASDDRLILHTEEGALPVRLEHGFAFVDPDKTGTRLAQSLTDPASLLGDDMNQFDAVLLLRREGLPPFLFEVAIGQLRSTALQQQRQREEESDTDYALRRRIEKAVFALMESAVRDWRGARVGLSVSREERAITLNAQIHLDAGGATTEFLRHIHADGTRFGMQLAQEVPLSLAANWQPTATGREILATIVESFRQKMDVALDDADAPSRDAVTMIIDAMEDTAEGQVFDSYLQVVGAPPNHFSLLGATAIGEATNVAGAIEQLLPFAAEAEGIREIEMNVRRADEVAIHRLWPQRLRKLDRRLYGDDAAIYLAAGRGALWMAVGGDGTDVRLADAILADSNVRNVESTHSASADDLAANRTAFLDLTLYASDWVGFARADEGGRNRKLVQLARQAFENPEEDRFRLQLLPASEGLQWRLQLDHGYIRWVGLALAARMEQR